MKCEITDKRYRKSANRRIHNVKKSMYVSFEKKTSIFVQLNREWNDVDVRVIPSKNEKKNHNISPLLHTIMTLTHKHAYLRN